MAPRILVVQPSLQPPGGANGLAAWMVDALHRSYDLSLLTSSPFDAGPVNEFYGTAIDGRLLRSELAWPRLHSLLERLPLPLALLKHGFLLRETARMAADFDLVIAANNEADFGRPGVQYINYPRNLRPRPNCELRWYHARPLLAPYYWAIDRLAGMSRDGIAMNLSLVNSDWTGRRVARLYGIAPMTLYPPVAGDFPEIPWEQRENGFVCIGRLSPEKELDRVFEIVDAVRQELPDAHLHLIGTAGRARYEQRILARARRESAWVTVHENVPRRVLVELLTRQRYGIHGMREEHFGMAIAEMVRAGSIVWVPNGGGQVEIVGHDERLLYRTEREAVSKILATVRDEGRQQDLRQKLRERGARFSAEQFCERLRQIVDQFLAGGRVAAG